MTALPKPEPRGPRPRRPIPRKSARVPVKVGRKRAKRTSKRKASRMQLRTLCDQLFSVMIRLDGRGRCETCGAAVGQSVQCGHLVSRRYLALRWHDGNAWALCSGCHVKYTHDPLAWDALVESVLGGTVWAGMKATALRGLGAPPLYAEIAPLLVEQLEATHRAVPYDALTEGLHERAAALLEKAGRMLG